MDERSLADARNATPPVPTFLSYGFRPFFLLGGIYAAVAMVAWMAWVGIHAAAGQVLWMSTDFPPFRWHAHEMLFGYTAAAIAGFVLTAVPGWTGRRPVAGRVLAALVGLWIIGRAAVWASAVLPAAAVAAADLAFPLALLAIVMRSLLGGDRRHFVFLAVLVLFFAGAALVHLERLGALGGGTQAGHRLALDAVVLLITVIGGRVVPAFTRNVLHREGDENPIPARPAVDRVAILLVAAVLVADQVAPGATVTGIVATAAALANAVRLAGWRTPRTLGQPILWIIHLGYGWLVAGLALEALALTTGLISEATALHALTVGAIGSMTIGIMTRAGLGHTGRVLRVSRPIVLAYVLISVAAVLRIAGPAWLPQYYNACIIAAGISWVAAFAIFAWVYWPILTGPRVSAAQ